MMRFKCNGEPIFDESFQEAIDKWAKAKSVDPEKVFEANGWTREGEPKAQMDIDRPVIKMGYGELKRPKPINTTVFEEAEVVEEIDNHLQK